MTGNKGWNGRCKATPAWGSDICFFCGLHIIWAWLEDLDENGEEPPDGELPGGGNMSQSSPWWSRPDTFPRKNATIPRYGFSSPGKTVTPIAFSGNTLQVDISNLWIVIFQALMSVGVIAQQSF